MIEEPGEGAPVQALLVEDGFRDRRPATTLTTVPIAELRRGDFSAARNTANQAVTIYDPATVRLNPATASGYIRDPFAGNRQP